MLATSIVDTHTLIQVVAYSLGAGVGVGGVFAAAISSLAGLAEARRHGRTAATLTYAGVLAVTLLVCAGAVGLGVVVMTTKT
jgi:hypothetical protein